MIFKNTFLLYFLKKLTTSFINTDAYKLGLIDENGKILKRIKTLKTKEEKNALTRLDILIFNLKKIIHKFPLGKTKLGTLAAALFLVKESHGILMSNIENSNIVLETMIKDYYERVNYIKLNEEAANATSSAIAGIGNDDLKLKKQILNFEDDIDDEVINEIDQYFDQEIESIEIEGRRILSNTPIKNLEEKYSVYAKDTDRIVKFNL